MRLTDKLAKTLDAQGKRQHIYRDDIITGFGLRITANGSRSFVLNYVFKGRERRLTFARYPDWSVAAAREYAAKLRRLVDGGVDPLAEREADRESKSVKDLADRYAAEIAPRKRASTQRNEASMWARIILPPFGARKLDDISPSDIDSFYAKIAAATPTQANRVIALLRHAYNNAVRWNWAARNPVTGIRRRTETPRERYLTRSEFDRFIAALRKRGNRPSALAIEFILVTGCRRGEALSASWAQFDLEGGIWTKPSAHTKSNKSHRVPLARGALDVLRRAHGASSTYVFPGRNGAALADVKKLFRAVCSEAAIDDMRIHDLRHTFASDVASGGTSLPMLGQLLGHTQVSTTARYAHLMDQPLRAAADIMSDVLEASERE